jgi:hypothetical protein
MKTRRGWRSNRYLPFVTNASSGNSRYGVYAFKSIDGMNGSIVKLFSAANGSDGAAIVAYPIWMRVDPSP